MSNSVGSRLRRFMRLDARRRALILEALLWLAVARLALLFLPFGVLASRFGRPVYQDKTASAAEPSPQVHDRIREIGWAVTRAARHAPFRAVCLPQAIAAKAMLTCRHIPSTMHFGVAKPGGAPLAAHAWLDSGPIEVTGFPMDGSTVEMVRFV